MIADTSFLIDLMREHRGALDKLTEIERESRRQFVASPSVFELAVGVAMSDLPEKEKTKIFGVLESFSIIPLTLESAWRAGLGLGELYNKGKPVDPIDGQIAGIALEQNEPIVTRNVTHFNRFPRLKVETY